MALNSDLICDILKRVDGVTIANAECASSLFRSATREEHTWEELCSSLWPSTRNEEVRSLISALGGFRKFYTDCFPTVLFTERVSAIDCNLDFSKSEESLSEYCDKELHSVSSSDFVSLVDVHYREIKQFIPKYFGESQVQLIVTLLSVLICYVVFTKLRTVRARPISPWQKGCHQSHLLRGKGKMGNFGERFGTT